MDEVKRLKIEGVRLLERSTRFKIIFEKICAQGNSGKAFQTGSSAIMCLEEFPMVSSLSQVFVLRKGLSRGL